MEIVVVVVVVGGNALCLPCAPMENMLIERAAPLSLAL